MKLSSEELESLITEPSPPCPLLQTALRSNTGSASVQGSLAVTLMAMQMKSRGFRAKPAVPKE